MTYFGLSCFFFASLLVTLNAVRIYDLVRIQGLTDAPELNGSLGFVKGVGDDHVEIQVFLSEPFITSSSSNLSDFFQILTVKEENLTEIGQEQWRADFTPSGNDCYKRQLLQQHLSPAQYAEYNAFMDRLGLVTSESANIFSLSQEHSEELQLIGVWSNQVFGTSFVKTLPDLCPFKRGVFVFIQGLVSRPEFNGHVGIINKRHEDRTEVLILLPSLERLSVKSVVTPESAFKPLLLRDQNMRLLSVADWKQETMRSDEELNAVMKASQSQGRGFNFLRVPCLYAKPMLTEADIAGLKNLKVLIEAVSLNSADFLRSDEDAQLRVKLIGAWINLRYGWHGMSITCEHGKEQNTRLYNAIDRLWNGIGAWAV